MKIGSIEILDEDIAINIKSFYWNVSRHRAEEYCEIFTPRKFSFGKYNGRNIGYICLTDHQYITWLLDNTNFELTVRELLLYKPERITIAIQGGREIGRGDIEEFHSCGEVNWEILNTLKAKQWT